MFTVAVLLVASFLPYDTDLIKQGIQSSLNGDYEASELIFSRVEKTTNDPALNFYRLVNAFKLNKKAEVEKLADNILNSFGIEYPQRYLDLATIMKADASTWTNERDDLEDISREMGKITDRLKNNKGGPDTQKIQKDVLSRLDKMIKDIEDKQKADAEAAAKAEADALEKFRKDNGIEFSPPPDTVPGNEQGSGQVNPKKVREIAEVWGKLPDKERAAALRELTRTLPAKDRAVIEAYFRELQKKKSR